METKMKGIYALMDLALVGIFGITMLDLMVIFTNDQFNILTIDNVVKMLLTIAGLYYLISVKIIGGIKDGILKRKIMKADLERKRMENDEYEKNHPNTD